MYELSLLRLSFRYYMPASYQFVRPLHFDYTGYVAVASVPLSPNLRHQAVLHDSRALSDALLTKSRFLATGTQVWPRMCIHDLSFGFCIPRETFIACKCVVCTMFP